MDMPKPMEQHLRLHAPKGEWIRLTSADSYDFKTANSFDGGKIFTPLMQGSYRRK